MQVKSKVIKNNGDHVIIKRQKKSSRSLKNASESSRKLDNTHMCRQQPFSNLTSMKVAHLILFILAGHEHNHKNSDEFKIRSDPTTDGRVS